MDLSCKKLERIFKPFVFLGQKVRITPVIEDGKAKPAEMQPELMFFPGDRA